MQSKTTRGVRHLLVSTGVISLVLSVAAPAALADKPDDLPEKKNEHAQNESPGADKVDICHNGHVITVDDDGELGGHSNHDDDVILDEDQRASCTKPSDDLLDDGELVDVCLDGRVEEIFESEVTEDHIVPMASVGGELSCPGGIIVGGEKTTVCIEGELAEVDEVPVGAGEPVLSEDDGELSCPSGIIVGGGKVEVCHQGAVLEVAADSLEDHLGHGDTVPVAEAAAGEECGGSNIVKDPVVVKDPVKDPVVVKDPIVVNDPVVVLDDPEVVVEVPVKNPSAAPVQPIPAPQPRPIVNISTDAVTKPVVPAAPATPAAPKRDNEVLGAITTRTPTPGVGALDPGAHAASITALAATGADGTKVLAVAGVILLLSGFGLQASGRRRMRSAVVEG